MNLLKLAKSWFGGAEGSWRGPFFGQGELGGWYELGRLEDGFQRNLDLRGHAGVAAMQAAINAYVNAFMLMPVRHIRGTQRVTTSALHRWLARPNGWQTPAEFWAMGIRSLLETGNAVGAVVRNDRFEPITVVWAASWTANRDPDTNDLYYGVSLTDGTGDPQYMVPARDILHLRINADTRSPLRGRSPVEFCAASMATNATLSAFLMSYLQNRASPSYALVTEEKLTRDQMIQLRSAWEDQAKGLASGKTPILSNGLKPEQLGVAPGDTLLVSTFDMTVTDIARAFSIPKNLLGIDETASNAENLMRSWLSLGLGGMVEMVEQGVERLFGLDRDDGVEFDADALLRMDPKTRSEMINQSVTHGVLSTDEGRALIGMQPVEGGYGRIPTQQQQQIPLDLLRQVHESNLASKVPQEQPVADEETKAEVAMLRKELDAIRMTRQQAEVKETELTEEMAALIARDALKKAIYV